jgi:hypothetical protein
MIKRGNNQALLSGSGIINYYLDVFSVQQKACRYSMIHIRVLAELNNSKLLFWG